MQKLLGQNEGSKNMPFIPTVHLLLGWFYGIEIRVQTFALYLKYLISNYDINHLSFQTYVFAVIYPDLFWVIVLLHDAITLHFLSSGKLVKINCEIKAYF